MSVVHSLFFQFSGNNIDCDYDGPDKKVLTYYCWISGATYVLRDPGAWNVAHEVCNCICCCGVRILLPDIQKNLAVNSYLLAILGLFSFGRLYLNMYTVGIA